MSTFQGCSLLVQHRHGYGDSPAPSACVERIPYFHESRFGCVQGVFMCGKSNIFAEIYLRTRPQGSPLTMSWKSKANRPACARAWRSRSQTSPRACAQDCSARECKRGRRRAFLSSGPASHEIDRDDVRTMCSDHAETHRGRVPSCFERVRKISGRESAGTCGDALFSRLALLLPMKSTKTT